MLVIVVCKSGLLASTIGVCSGKVSCFRWLYRLRLLSAASSQAPCLWLVAHRTGDTLARSDRGLRFVSRRSRGQDHELASVWPTRRHDPRRGDRGRYHPGARAHDLPEVATLEEASHQEEGWYIHHEGPRGQAIWREAMEFFHDIKSDDEDDDEDEEEQEPENDESLELAPDEAESAGIADD